VLGLFLAACSRRPETAPVPRPAPSTAPAPRPSTPRIPAPLSDEDLVYLRRRGLIVPVVGVYPSQLHDSFAEGRDSGERRHNAIDILVPRGTPIVSADDGRVARLSSNSLGGITVYATDPGQRFVYYYAHLEAYQPGLAEGMPLAKGQVIGYVGTTGNAPANTPHLHFQVMRAGEGRRWWDGVPVNPRPFFVMGGNER
jgi:murein DD-endopeptidase MepM/ murein hydrolase activator NlpD